MSDKDAKRHYLFDLYAENWTTVKREPYVTRVAPDVDDVFVCPICFKFFTREDLSYQDVLSLEHVPPKSLGGMDAECTLTCHKCNSKAGSKLEAQLTKKLALEDVLAGVPGTSFDVQYSLVTDGEEI
jgi:5-methylcytosine-specific restriction endonuclease McrA